MVRRSSYNTHSAATWLAWRNLELAAITGIALLFFCCGGSRKASLATPAGVDTPIVPAVAEYRISAGDRLDVKLYYHPELNAEAWVRPDGFISLQLVGEIQAAGHTPSELDSTLQKLYNQKLVNPEVAVMVKSSASQKVYVGGEVNNPRMISYESALTLAGAVFEAGGFKPSASVSHVHILRNDPVAGPQILEIDLKPALKGRSPDANVALQAFDVVFVPRSGIAKANLFVDQFIDGLLPVSTVSGFAWVYFLIQDRL